MTVTLPVEETKVDQGTKEGNINGPGATGCCQPNDFQTASQCILCLNPLNSASGLRDTSCDNTCTQLDPVQILTCKIRIDDLQSAQLYGRAMLAWIVGIKL